MRAGREAIRRQDCCPPGSSFSIIPPTIRVWSSRGVENALNTVAVPTLTVGGYYDQEDMCGPQEEYAKLEPHDAKHENFLVLGPWRHGYWSSSSRAPGQSRLRRADRQGVSRAHRGEVLRALSKDEPGFDLEDTASFQTGSNTWQYYAALSAGRIAAHKPLSRGRGAARAGARRQARRATAATSAIPPIPFRIATGPSSPLTATARSGTTGSPKISASSPAARTWPSGSCPCSTQDLTAHRRGRRRHLCLHHRHRQRSGRQADRPISRTTIPTQRCAAIS